MATPDHGKAALSLKKKKDFDYLTSSVLMEHQKHLLASLHFKAIYDRLLFIPSIMITLAGGILAILAQSGIYSEDTKSAFTISIAVLASFSVFWQSLMKQLDYGGKASLHDSAATALNKIYKLALMRSMEQKSGDLGEQLPDGSDNVEAGVHVLTVGTNEENTKKEEDNSASGKALHVPVVRGEDHTTLSKQFEQALQGCTSNVPIKISAAFDSLESSINVCNKRLMPSACPKPKIAWEKIYPALYHQLTLTIIGSKMWPYVEPEARWAVEMTIKKFQRLDARLLAVLIARTGEIDKQYMQMHTTSRNLPSETTPLLPFKIRETV